MCIDWGREKSGEAGKESSEAGGERERGGIRERVERVGREGGERGKGRASKCLANMARVYISYFSS